MRTTPFWPDLPRSADSLAAAAHYSDSGLLVFDGHARVLAFNGAAAALLGPSGPVPVAATGRERRHAYRLVFADPALQAAVEQAVVDCADSGANGHAEADAVDTGARTLLLDARRGRRTRVLRLAPVPSGADGLRDARVIGIVADLRARPSVEPDQFGEVFALSSAASRVAQAYLHVDSVKDASRALGISVNTVKSHLAAIYERTGCSRQSQLIRLLMTLSRRDCT